MLTPWFSRTFDRVEPSLLPCLIERVLGTPARVEERVRDLGSERATRRVDSRWSIQEHVGHLLDLESLWSGRVEDLFGGAKSLREADLENRATDDAEHNAADLPQLLHDFRERRVEWIVRIASASPECARRTALHPRLHQPMSLADLAHFVAEHDDHHLARIAELLAVT